MKSILLEEIFGKLLCDVYAQNRVEMQVARAACSVPAGPTADATIKFRKPSQDNAFVLIWA
jgi:hypothetical protein